MIIRSGTVQDAAAMVCIYNHYVRTSPVIFSCQTLTVDEMKEKIDRLELGARFPFLVAESEGRIIGYAYSHLWMPDPVYARSWEVTIYLDKDSCGQGAGSALLSELVDRCREAGAHILVSWVTEGNIACERLHLRTGFTLTGRIPESGWKFGKYWNDCVYQLIL